MKKKIAKLCLHSSYKAQTAQTPFYFDEIFVTENSSFCINFSAMKRSVMAKQNSLDDVGLGLDEGDDDYDTPDSANLEGFGRDSPRPGTPITEKEEVIKRTLPWTPKVRQKDLDSFLDYTRMKFVGFTLNNDRTTLAGLPNPIHEGVRILNSHMYKSLAELQVEVEDEIAQNPLSKPEGEVEQTAAEILYAAMLPSLPQVCF